MKKVIFFAAIFAVCFFNSCDLSSSYPQTTTAAQLNPEEAKMAAIQQKLAERQNQGEISEEQAAALLLLILAAMANESGTTEASAGYNNGYNNSGYSEDEVMDLIVDEAINPPNVINYNY